jgi:hypothetical protein
MRGEYRRSAIASQDLSPKRDPARRFCRCGDIVMNSISIVAERSNSAATASDQSLKAIVLLSCLGLLASLCMTALGLDVSVGWL